jgi:hypothetical protein
VRHLGERPDTARATWHCGWVGCRGHTRALPVFVDKDHNDVGRLLFAGTVQPSALLRITMRTSSAKLTLNWAPNGFFDGGLG